MSDELLRTIYRDRPGVIDELRVQIEQGADPNYSRRDGETALRVASNKGRFDVVDVLLRSGADPRQLGWTALFHAIAFGTPEDVGNCLAEGADLTARDWWDRTPWLLSLQTGVVETAAALLAAGSDPKARGRAGKIPMAYAVESGEAGMVRWLIAKGFDVDAADNGGRTALMTAAEQGATDCARVLLEAGADPFREDDDSESAIGMAATLSVVTLLLDAGADVGDLCNRRRAELLGLGSGEFPALSEQVYRAAKHRRFGTSNPELAKEPFWQAMTRWGEAAYHARKTFDDTGVAGDPAVWCYVRFGMSITALPDGRFIEIAGEHEDAYDPDFCIYNDVFVHKGGGDFDI